MKKMITSIVLLLLLVFPLFAFDLCDLEICFAWQPVIYYLGNDIGGSNSNLDLTFDAGQYTVYHANLKFRSGLNFGFGIGIDSGYNVNNNFVGFASDILAFIGYNDFKIRISNGNFSGTEHDISGSHIRLFYGQKTQVDLIYGSGGLYGGVFYKYLKTPNSIAPIGEHNNEIGDSVTHLYGLIGGIDTFTAFLENKPFFYSSKNFGLWWEGWINYGIGWNKDVNSNDSIFARSFGLSSTIGLLLGGGKSIRFCIGMGFNSTVDYSLFHFGIMARVGIKF